MEYYTIPLIFSFVFCCLYFMRLCIFSSSSKLPPGPKPLPVFGNIFQLTDRPYNSMMNLSKIYGPLMSLQLGFTTTVVVSSAEMAREIFIDHDTSFSSRQVPDAGKVLNHQDYSVVWLPLSPQWRNLKKISSMHLFSTRSLDASQFLRQKKLQELRQYIGECCKNNEAVDVSGVAFTTMLNLISNTIFSIDLAGYGSGSSNEFRGLISSALEVVGRANVSDFFPVLSCFDLLGRRREASVYMCKIFEVIEDIINQRLSAGDHVSSKDDFLETLLKISREEGSDHIDLRGIKHLIFDMFAAGIDTTSNTLEWAMMELLQNPAKMVKAQAEIEEVVGKDGPVQESDIGRLPYLQAVVKETLRLHPTVPFLLRKAANHVTLHGYEVPKNTQLLVNVWAIGRDPETWKNPIEFSPERFIERETDMRGRDFELIPFGCGRKMCLGYPLAYRMAHIMLATLLHSFDWKLGDDLRELDTTEKCGLTLKKAKPLLAIPLAK